MDPSCVVFGPLISWAVDLLKRLPPVRRSPKGTAFVLTLLATAAKWWWRGPGPFDLQAFLLCVAAAFGAAVATHEVITDPVRRVVGSPTP